ncbi:hypothetical protein [Bizionia sp.]|uniref:hypothetical protein n=1 Tax=Bizionia sp. TaxID=1954480 RepID=UPI003A8FB440
MRKPYLFVLFVLTLLNCSDDNSKVNYLDNFAVFIDELEFQEASESKINWENKEDSLNMFTNRKNKFRLSAKDEQDINLLVKRFKELKGTASSSEMSVNFYFENSASMNGYLNGKYFKQVMHRIYGNLNTYTVNPFFVNTKEYPQVDILNKIDNSNIKVGDIGNSDHQFIFSNAIENAINNNLSIVITDGIYSVKDGDVDIVSIDIENAFKNALSRNEIETVVFKLSSEFKGTYYSETCEPGKKAININQYRPYYVLLFGNSNSIDKALKDITIIDELEGFEKQARFFLTKNLKANYTILTTGEEKHGQFKASKRGSDIIEEIEDVEKFEKSGFGGTPKSENYLQFGIAIDYSSINLPNTYKEDIENYWVDDQLGYTVTEIINVSDMDKSSRTFREVQRINDKNKTNFTHVIKVKADKSLYGNLKIQLQNNLPSWIEITGTDNDCNIIDDISHTFVFDQLMFGISKGYQKINNNSQYLEINLKIKV